MFTVNFSTTKIPNSILGHISHICTNNYWIQIIKINTPSVEIHGSPGPDIHWEILGETTLVISQGNPEQSQKYNLLPTQQVSYSIK